MFFAHSNSWAFRLPRGLSEPSAITKGIQRQEHATHNTSNTDHLFTEFCHRAERNPLSEHVRPLLLLPSPLLTTEAQRCKNNLPGSHKSQN